LFPIFEQGKKEGSCHGQKKIKNRRSLQPVHFQREEEKESSRSPKRMVPGHEKKEKSRATWQSYKEKKNTGYEETTRARVSSPSIGEKRGWKDKTKGRPRKSGGEKDGKKGPAVRGNGAVSRKKAVQSRKKINATQYAHD